MAHGIYMCVLCPARSRSYVHTSKSSSSSSTCIPVEVLPHGRVAGARRIWVRHDLRRRRRRHAASCFAIPYMYIFRRMHMHACLLEAGIYTYQRVEVVAAAGDADERRRGGGGRLEEAAVADVLGAIGDGHGDRGHEQVHHLANHPPHHQRIHEPRHDYC